MLFFPLFSFLTVKEVTYNNYTCLEGTIFASLNTYIHLWNYHQDQDNKLTHHFLKAPETPLWFLSPAYPYTYSSQATTDSSIITD